MQRCINCKTEFKWKEIYRYLWGHLFNPIKCESCGEDHYITVKGRLTNSMLVILPMLLFGQFLSPFNHMLLSLGFGISVGLIGSLLTPFLVTFKIEETKNI
ncbi:hypothetical protein LCM10_03935 [Rossellomorea aquimaris]|uniref:TIGR04104 family putative zinc finger protein n=1 Tax=Rossellomorea aquimaris TaxID=189382 RepID=UPI001CD7B714|nr:TIGR04104 family putative zinc finger protein [Rossellomorea aquimaris]MCA1054126.1 hypothetical protein [Rossellomorea aquimaris]